MGFQGPKLNGKTSREMLPRRKATVQAIHRSGIYWRWWKSNSQPPQHSNEFAWLHSFSPPLFTFIVENSMEVDADFVWMNSICSVDANLFPIKDYFRSLGKCRRSQSQREACGARKHSRNKYFTPLSILPFDGFLMPPPRHCNPFKMEAEWLYNIAECSANRR